MNLLSVPVYWTVSLLGLLRLVDIQNFTDSLPDTWRVEFPGHDLIEIGPVEI